MNDESARKSPWSVCMHARVHCADGDGVVDDMIPCLRATPLAEPY